MFAIVMSTLLVFPADAGTAKKKEDVTIMFTGMYVSESSPKIEWRANYLITKKFFAEHPWMHVKFITSLVLPGGMNVQGADMTMSMVGDAAPDVFYLQSEDLSRSVSQGFLMPLDDYVKNWPEADRRLKGSIRDMCSRIGPDGKKHIYALPFAVGSECLLYNRKRFRDVGLTRGPRDWNEMWEFGKKLYNADIDPETDMPRNWAIGLPLDGWFFPRLPAYAGGKCWEKNPDGSWKSMLDSEACVKTLDMLKKMLWGEWTDNKGRHIKGVMNLSLILAQQGGRERSALAIEGRRDVEESGTVGMALNSFYNNFNERMYKDPEIFGIVPFPKYGGPEGRYAHRIGGTLISLKSTITDKKVADAAWVFASYMCGEAGEREKTKIFIDNGVARYVNPALLKEYGYPPEIIKQVPKDWAEAYKTIFDHAYAEEDPPGLASIQKEIESATKQLVRNPYQDSRKVLAKVQNMVARSYMYTPKPEEMNHNRKIALVVVILMAAMMAAGGVLIFRIQVRDRLADERERVYVRKVPRSKQLLAWALLSPAVLSVFLWQYIPLLWGSVMAFLNVHILGGIGASEWVGLDNFINVAMRPLFWHAWKITIIWVIMNLAMGFLAPVILALLLSEIPKGKVFFRTLYYLPALTTGVIVSLLWMRFYDPTQYGLMNRVLLSFDHSVLQNINHLLTFLHIPWIIPQMQPIGWLQDPKFAMAACILPGVLSGMGPGCIMYLAALKSVPEEQYDAADLDGAGIFHKTWHITFPTIFPLILINFVGAFTGAFHSSGNLLIMTGGGPEHATHVMGLEIWYQGYVLANYGQTTAIAWALGSILVGFAVLQMRIFARMKFSTAEQGE